MYRNLYRHINRHICLLTHRIPYRQVNHTGHHHCHHISVNILLIFIITVLINCHWSVGVEMDKEIEGENAISRVVLCQTDWFAQMTNCWSCLNTTWITSYDFITSCNHYPHHHHHHDPHHHHHHHHHHDTTTPIMIILVFIITPEQVAPDWPTKSLQASGEPRKHRSVSSTQISNDKVSHQLQEIANTDHYSWWFTELINIKIVWSFYENIKV